MIRITNGRLTLTVTAGAFKDVYKSQGFREIADSPDTTTKIALNGAEAPRDEITLPSDTDAVQDDSRQETGGSISEAAISRKEELAEIPLNEMTPEQLREYAKLLGVDIRGLKSKTAVKDKIRSVL